MSDKASDVSGLIAAEMAEVKSLIGGQAKVVEVINGKLKELEQKAAPAEVIEQVRSLAEKQQKRLDALEVAAQTHETKAHNVDWGHALAANAEFKSICANPEALRRGGGIKIEMPGFKTVLGAGELGVLSLDVYRPGIIQRPQRRPRLIDLVAVLNLGSGETYKYNRETAKSAHGIFHCRLDGAIALNATEAVLTRVDGLQVGYTLRFHATAGFLEKEILTVTPATRTVTWSGGIGGSGVQDGADITCRRVSAIAESGSKPYTYMEAEQKSITVIERPILLSITEQRLRIPNIAEWIRAELPRRIRAVLNPELLYGRGPNFAEFSGLFSDAELQTYAQSDGIEGDTMADAVLAASDLVISDGALTALLNRGDWRKLTKAKTAVALDYIHGQNKAVSIIDTPMVKAISDVLVELDPNLEPADFGVFDFETCSVVANQDAPAAIRIGWDVGNNIVAAHTGDQFARNELTVRYEVAAQQAVLSPLTYVQGEFDGAPSGE